MSCTRHILVNISAAMPGVYVFTSQTLSPYEGQETECEEAGWWRWGGGSYPIRDNISRGSCPKAKIFTLNTSHENVTWTNCSCFHIPRLRITKADQLILVSAWGLESLKITFVINRSISVWYYCSYIETLPAGWLTQENHMALHGVSGNYTHNRKIFSLKPLIHLILKWLHKAYKHFSRQQWILIHVWVYTQIYSSSPSVISRVTFHISVCKASEVCGLVKK